MRTLLFIALLTTATFANNLGGYSDNIYDPTPTYDYYDYN